MTARTEQARADFRREARGQWGHAYVAATRAVRTKAADRISAVIERKPPRQVR